MTAQDMSTPQPGILADVPPLSRYLEFSRIRDADPRAALAALAALPVDEGAVIGLGAGLVMGLGGAVEGLRNFPAFTGPGVEVPSTQADLWVWIRGTDRGRILHRGRAIKAVLAPAFLRVRLVDGFKFDASRDLTGYEDGTENPKDEAAVDAAVAEGLGAGLDGSSFVAAQQWVHDLAHMESLPAQEQDDIIGRHKDSNEEVDEAPPIGPRQARRPGELRPGGLHGAPLHALGGRERRGADVRRLRAQPGCL
jgi:putative iron-dependent peroxidase